MWSPSSTWTTRPTSTRRREMQRGKGGKRRKRWRISMWTTVCTASSGRYRTFSGISVKDAFFTWHSSVPETLLSVTKKSPGSSSACMQQTFSPHSRLTPHVIWNSNHNCQKSTEFQTGPNKWEEYCGGRSRGWTLFCQVSSLKVGISGFLKHLHIRSQVKVSYFTHFAGTSPTWISFSSSSVTPISGGLYKWISNRKWFQNII